jgi:hypothetical protein
MGEDQRFGIVRGVQRQLHRRKRIARAEGTERAIERRDRLVAVEIAEDVDFDRPLPQQGFPYPPEPFGVAFDNSAGLGVAKRDRRRAATTAGRAAGLSSAPNWCLVLQLRRGQRAQHGCSSQRGEASLAAKR